MKTKLHHGHSNGNGLLTLARERATLLDGEVELSCGPRGVIAEVVPNSNPIDAASGEPIGVRVSLHPFLAGMNHHHLMLLTDCALVVHFRKGEVILNEGDHADQFYLIETGKVVLEAITEEHEHVLVETISAGDLLGWSWMFPPYIWQFTARAVEPTTALFFYAAILREYCENDHSLGYELLKRISAVIVRRLQAAARKKAERQMREIVRSVNFGRVEFETVFTEGSPVSDICAFAKDNEVDLIITSTHGLTGLKHVLIGSIAEQVVRHAPCSVLVVPSHPQVRAANLAKSDGARARIRANRKQLREGPKDIALTRKDREFAMDAFPERRKTNKSSESHK